MGTVVTVFGATGTVGGRLLAELQRYPALSVRAVTRGMIHGMANDERLRWYTADLDDPNSLVSALQSVNVVFLLTPGAMNLGIREMRLLSLCEAQGITGIVKLSSISAGNKKSAVGRQHAAVEAYLLETARLGLHNVSVLRCTDYMTRFLSLACRDPEERPVLFPAGVTTFNLLDPADIAECATRCILDMLDYTPRSRALYTLTGPDMLELSQIDQELSNRLNLRMPYQIVPLDHYADTLMARGIGSSVAKLCEMEAIGQMLVGCQQPTADIFDLLGRPSRTFGAFLERLKARA